LIETVGLGAGSYPEPNEVIDEEPYDWYQDDYDTYMADIIHEEMMIGGTE
jgi:hypothetical protein